MTFSRFDMEQQLLDCWGITDELNLLMEGVLERDLTKDQVSNILLGMQELYSLKFTKLWESFEDGIHSRQIL